MRTHVAFTPAEEVAAPVGIVVDVLRATSTITQALSAGYGRVLCCSEVEEARAVAASEGDAVLAGERGTVRIDGFDFGNSPREFLEPAAEHARPDDDERHSPAPRCGALAVMSCSSGRSSISTPWSRRLRAAQARVTSLSSARACRDELALDDAYCAGRIAAALDGEPADSAAAAMRLARQLRDERGRARRVPERAQPPRQRPRRGHRVVRAGERARRRSSLLAHGRARGRGDGDGVSASRFGRPPTVAANGMVATSQPLATRAGLRALEQGGNAADAALAAAAVLAVTEPTGNGIGGDNFAIVWKRRTCRRPRFGRSRRRRTLSPHGGDDPRAGVRHRAGSRRRLGGARRAVREARPRPLPLRCHRRRGERLRRHAADGCCLAARRARARGVSACAERGGDRASARPRARRCAASPRAGQRAFYEGDVARSIASVTWLEEEDLAAHEARWVEPLSISYRGHEVLEMPPPTQGVAALEGLGLLERSSPTLATQIRCMRLALEDALERVRDGADVSELISPEFLDRRRAEKRSPSPSRQAAPCTSARSTATGWRSRSSSRTTWASARGSSRPAPGSRSRTAEPASP